MLLTSGQVSLFLSTAIIAGFTVLLFASGYFLQRQTVTSLRNAIRPPLPKLPSMAVIEKSLNTRELGSSRAFRGASFSPFQNGAEETQQAEQPSSVTIDWARLAHVQLVKDHDDLCNAVMYMSQLQAARSPASRVLMFPKAWVIDGKGGVEDPSIDSSRRLLRAAARRYRVTLRPMNVPVAGAAPEIPSSYSLISLFSMHEYDKILYVKTPGNVVKSALLDAILALSADNSITMNPPPATGGKPSSADVVLIKPSTMLYQRLSQEKEAHRKADPVLFSSLGDNINYLTPEIASIFASTQELREVHEGSWNLTTFIDNTGYIAIHDPDLPGPQYDVPHSQRVASKPTIDSAGRIWTRTYEGYRQRRMDVCGLDLENML